MSGPALGDGLCTAAVGPFHHADPRVAEVRKGIHRRLMRFLDQATLPVYAVIDQAYAQSSGPDPAELAVFTVSSWEPSIPPPPVSDPAELVGVDRAKLCFESTDPLMWLRLLATSPLCQVSIARGFRGPNAHFHGGRAAVLEAFRVARCYVEAGMCSGAVVAAFDTPPDGIYAVSSEADTTAYAILVEPSERPTGVLEEIEVHLAGGDPADRAVDALAACGPPALRLSEHAALAGADAAGAGPG